MADEQGASRIGELRGSARGWHGVQLAVLGFIGLCGVLQQEPVSGEPHWLRVLSGLLVLAAFALACVATVLVALAAWPIYAPRTRTPDEDGEVASTSRRLRLGITLTYVAVAVLALATSSSWWPGGTGSGADRRAVEVTTRAGQVCGGLETPSQEGVLAVSAGGRVVEFALSDVASVRPVDAC
ncbi:MAG: hypothetical protein JWP24_2957 [Marmoricola sp.]|jgi:hypothetical protein|nr:hypothetical protein [Marmoricola sp.]